MRWEKIFNCELVTDCLMLALQFQKNTATCCNASPRGAGLQPAGTSTGPRSSQDGAPATAPAVTLLHGCWRRARDAGRRFDATVLTAVFKKSSCHGNCHPGLGFFCGWYWEMLARCVPSHGAAVTLRGCPLPSAGTRAGCSRRPVPPEGPAAEPAARWALIARSAERAVLLHEVRFPLANARWPSQAACGGHSVRSPLSGDRLLPCPDQPGAGMTSGCPERRACVAGGATLHFPLLIASHAVLRA